MVWLVMKAFGAGALIAGALWIIDEIGDRRETKVRAEYARKIAEADKAAAHANAYWRSHYEKASADREALVTDAIREIRSKQPDVCEPSESLRKKLNAINPRIK